MFTTGSKYWFGLAALFFGAALVYGLSTGGEPLGADRRYKTAVGDHLRHGILLFAAACSLVIGVLNLAWRDADPEAQAALAGTEEVPEADAPNSPSCGLWSPCSLGIVAGPSRGAVPGRARPRDDRGHRRVDRMRGRGPADG